MIQFKLDISFVISQIDFATYVVPPNIWLATALLMEGTIQIATHHRGACFIQVKTKGVLMLES